MSGVLHHINLWQQELLDLSNRNRLLNFRPSTTRPSSIQLTAPLAESVYEELLQGKPFVINGVAEREEVTEEEQTEAEDELYGGVGASRIPAAELNGLDPLLPQLSPGSVQSNLPLQKLNTVALRLLRQARSSEQEQGINILFAVFGLLKWGDGVSEASRGFNQHRQAPLLLLPLRIEENVRDGRFRITSVGDDPEFNQTLTERLRRDFGLSLPLEMNEDQRLTDFFDNIRDAIGEREGWEVQEQVHIGLFQYHKIRMFKDLNEHAALAAEHDIIKALAQEGVTIAGEPDGMPVESDLDRLVTPQDSHSVLDADASQLEAVQAVKRGSHLLIQGPPGTGKSQTIANIIAENIAAGKRVLFVSEKAAAIEVVHRRLTQQGLDEFCLMLHSHKANKRDVIYDLASQMEPLAAPALTPDDELRMQQLIAARQKQNAYAETLHHKREPMGLSAFWAHGELAQLAGLPFLLAPVPPIEELTFETLDRWQTTVSHVAGFSETLREGLDHPWSSFVGANLGLAQEGVLRHALTSLIGALADIRRFGSDLSSALELPEPTTLNEVRRLVRIVEAVPFNSGLLPEWFDVQQNGKITRTANEAAERALRLKSRANALFAAYTERVLELPTPETIASYEKGALARLFSSQYRGARSRMREAAREGKQRSRDEELQLLHVAKEVKDDISWFTDRRDLMTDTLGVAIDGVTLPNVIEIAKRVEGVAASSKILAEFNTSRPDAEFIHSVCSPVFRSATASSLGTLNLALQGFGETLAQLNEFFEARHLSDDGVDIDHMPLGRIQQVLDSRLTRWNDLSDWIGSRLAMQRTESEGLRPVIDKLLAENIPADQWSGVFRRLVLTHWLDNIYQAEVVLREFRGPDHSELIEKFRALDHHLIDTGPQRLRRLFASRRDQIGTAAGEPALLRHEASKRRRHMPLRRLFARIPNLLPTLKPCLMMSPLSVAQFLPADRYRFDIVIFDEASQVRPHDAIGAILRGRQLVVAGDSKQLPPTSFFDRVDDLETEEQDEDLRALESILDGLRAKGMPTRSLLWHYRSRHEDLIAYSNHHFYEDRLVTFPSPSAESAPGKGVRLEYVPDGRYEQETDRVLKTAQRVNRSEAKRVAQLVMEHARTRSDESLGVVALGTTQRDIVEDEIKQARLLDESCEPFFSTDNSDPFFVKALEQVQGDERDVMMISIGFGKNAQGVLSHNFGPINRDGGERRLNVLVTRARHEVIVVSSIRGSDIDLARTQKLGPRLLKNYLDFAERGRGALEAQTTGGDGEYDSPFEASVGQALQRAGYTVHRQVGASRFRIDLAVVHPDYPGRYLLGVECDGRTYHQSKTARDRDRLRQEVLEGLGWTIHRIWSTEWIRHPERELDRVVSRIDELLQEDAQSARKESDLYAEDVISEGLVAQASMQSSADYADAAPASHPVAPSVQTLAAEPYQTAELSVVEYGAILDAPMPALVQAVVDCVNVEGPIHQDLLGRRIVSAWGHQRTGTRIASLIDRAVFEAVRQQLVSVTGRFFWPSNASEPVPRGADEYGVLRDIKHVCDEELLEGMRQMLRQAFSLSEDEVVSQTARFFGYQRTGADISRRLREVLRAGVDKEAIEYRADRYTWRDK